MLQLSPIRSLNPRSHVGLCTLEKYSLDCPGLQWPFFLSRDLGQLPVNNTVFTFVAC